MVQVFWNKFKRGLLGGCQSQGSGFTDVGQQRSHNEDAIFTSDAQGLYLVADGMGGHAHGEVASALAIKTISEEFVNLRGGKPVSILNEVIQEANRRIYRQSKTRLPEDVDATLISGNMGTTVVAMFISGEDAVIAHVGDSRVYRMRGDRLERLTRDHSLAEFAGPSDAQPPAMFRARYKNIITRALGIEAEVEIDMRHETLKKGDLFLLCSDGLTNMVPDQQISTILASQQDSESICQTLIDEANRSGGKDNISSIAIRYG